MGLVDCQIRLEREESDLKSSNFTSSDAFAFELDSVFLITTSLAVALLETILTFNFKS